MKFAKIAWNDISSIFKNRFIRVSVIAIIVVPLLYSLLYLAAFWDPYSRLSELPVAVVNMDKGTIKDEKNVNYGQDLVDNLKDNTEVKWTFVSLEEATKGVSGDKYYSMFIIPEDFSKKVMSAKDGKPEEARMTYTSNDKKNFLAAQIGGRVEDKLKAEVIKNISKEYTKVTFDNLYEIKDGMIQAADGSKQIADGNKQLNDKVPEMADGVGKLSDGANQLKDGLSTLNGNVPAMASGVSQLYDGASRLEDGINSKAFGGMKSLNGGLSALNGKIPELAGGISQLNYGVNTTAKDQNGTPLGLREGLKALNTGLSAANGGVAQISDGMDRLNNAVNVGDPSKKVPSLSQAVSGLNAAVNGDKGLSKSVTDMDKLSKAYQQAVATGDAQGAAKYSAMMAQAINQLNQSVNVGDASKGMPSLASGVAKLDAAVNIGDASTKTPALKDAVAQLNAGVNVGDPAKGVPSLKYGIGAASAASGKLVAGADKVGAGLSQIDSKVPELKSGVGLLADGSTQLLDGTKAMGEGSTQLKDGLGQLNGKIPELASGASKLYDGSTQLSDGLGKLNSSIPELKDGTQKLADGSKELSDKLQDGADEMGSNLKNSSDDMGKFVSEPLKVNDEAMNAVKDYGTGFTPYFIPLSLWVGAIMMFFVISGKVEDGMDAGPISTVVGKYLSYGFIGTLQAVLVSAVVLTLGLKPHNMPMYFLFNILMSFAFIAIIQSLIFILGDAGRLIAIVLLILQLTACAGTFPLELVPKFFKVLNPYMPFTYCVSGLREIISGSSASIIAKDVSILAGILVVFLVIAVLLKERGDKFLEMMEEKKQTV